MSLDLVRIYLICFCGVVCCPLLFIVIRWSGVLLAPHMRRLRATMVHSTLTFWPRTTYLQSLAVMIYTGLNAVVLSIGIMEEESLSKRASLIASANLMLLFVGGRTNPLADFVQIPLFTYSFLHRWISVIATCEALLHSSIELYHWGLKDKNAISGCMACYFTLRSNIPANVFYVGFWRPGDSSYRRPLAGKKTRQILWEGSPFVVSDVLVWVAMARPDANLHAC